MKIKNKLQTAQQNPSSTLNQQEQQQTNQQTSDYLEKQLKQMSTTTSSQNQQYNLISTQKNTPLTFKLPLNTHTYLISYKQKQCNFSTLSSGISAIVKIIILLIVASLMTIPLFYYTELSEKYRAFIIALMFSIPFLYACLFFLDPGTVFDDEEESFSQQRIYCITCEIYRNISTKHCTFCNRCCKKYDHHCSVFGKCIGKRNLLLFYLFIINNVLTFVLYFIVSVEELYGQFNQKQHGN